MCAKNSRKIELKEDFYSSVWSVAITVLWGHGRFKRWKINLHTKLQGQQNARVLQSSKARLDDVHNNDYKCNVQWTAFIFTGKTKCHWQHITYIINHRIHQHSCNTDKIMKVRSQNIPKWLHAFAVRSCIKYYTINVSQLCFIAHKCYVTHY